MPFLYIVLSTIKCSSVSEVHDRCVTVIIISIQ